MNHSQSKNLLPFLFYLQIFVFELQRSGNKSDVTNEVITSLLSKLSQNDESPFLSVIEKITDSDDER